jgi:hypothetical protein
MTMTMTFAHPQQYLAWRRRLAACCALCLLALLAGSGCQTHPQVVGKIKLEMMQGRLANPEQLSSALNSSNDQLLLYLERGRLRQINDDLDGSMADYLAAMSFFDQEDAKARYTATGAGSQVMATMVNDRTLPYSGRSYERIMLLQQQALNVLAMGDYEGLGVMVNNLAYQIGQAEKRYQEELEAVEKQRQDGHEKAYSAVDSMPAFQNQMAAMNRDAAKVRNSFQNAYVYYFSGMYYESRQDWSNAYLAYKTALRLQPTCRTFQDDVRRLARRMQREEELKEFGLEPAAAPSVTPAPGAGIVVFFYEQDYVDEKQSFQLAVPIPTHAGVTLVNITFPYYPEVTNRLVPLAIQSRRGQELAVTELACDLQRLAVKDLSEQMPGIITRMVIRATLKAVAGHEMQRQMGLAAGLAATLAMALLEQPDLRSWLLLPRYAQVARLELPAGEHELALVPRSALNMQQSISVPVSAGKTTVVHIVGVPGRMISRVTPLP